MKHVCRPTKSPFAPVTRWCGLAAIIVWIIASLPKTALAQKILPLGDSITDGYQVPGGYRTELYEQLTNAGASFTFQGSQTDNPSGALTAGSQVHHEGHSGYRTDQIYNNLEGNDGTSGNNGGYWLSGGNGTGRQPISPDIVLVHIGTNDRTQGETPQTMYNKLVTLLNDLKADLPNAKVFVASLIPRTDNATYETDQQTYNAMIPGLVASLGTNFHFVDMHSVVTPAQVAGGNSGLHPNQAGYDAMGDAWFNAIQSQQGLIGETDQSNIGDNSNDATNSTFYFTSGQTTSPAAALRPNLLTGSIPVGNPPDIGSLTGLDDLSVCGPGYGSYSNVSYYGYFLFGSSLYYGPVTNTIPLGGATPVPGGYTLSSILVFGAWGDHASFSDQFYTLYVSMDGTNFTPLHSVNFMPFTTLNDLNDSGTQDSSTLVTLTNLNANGLASGIRYVRFVFSAGLDTDGNPQEGQLTQEIEAFGTPTLASTNGSVLPPGQIGEIDRSNLGDNNSDTNNSQFYFTSGQTLNTSAALLANLLTGSTTVSSTGGADVGSVAAINDGNAQPGTGAIAYYGNTLFGSSLNTTNTTTHGIVTLTIPLGGGSPSATGYTLNYLSAFSGWTDHASFSDQHYDVSVSRDGTNYLYLYSVNYMPFLAANDQASSQSSSSLVILTNLNASGLATGIKYIRFTLTAGLDVNNQAQEGQLIQEIEVFGAASPTAGPIVEHDQSNIGDNNNDAGNSQFYFTSGQTLSTSAALQTNLLTGSTAVSSTGGADVGSVATINDVIAQSGTAAIAYYGNTLFGNSLNPANAFTHGVVSLTIPLGGASPATNGYTLSGISVFEGWTDHASFNDQHYIISTSSDGTNYYFLDAVNYLPFLTANDIVPAGQQDASSLVTLSNLNVSGVKSIRFALSAGLDGNGALQQGQILQEIEVFGTPTVVPASRPVITSATCSGGSLIFSGTNGTSDSPFYVLTSTNVAAPLGNWTYATTNNFDSNGNFRVTNSIDPAIPVRFYRLRLP